MKTPMKNFIVSTLFLLIMLGCGGNSSKIKLPPAAPLEPAPILQLPNLPTYNVFVENSGSMDGYVAGITAFESAVYSYLSDMKIAGLADSLNLNYINSEKIPFSSDVKDFIEKLEPSTFRLRGGNRAQTDVSELFKMVLESANDSNVCVLISDFIFSPGKGVNSDEYLVNQQIGIKMSVAEHLKRFPDHAVIIYHLESKFNGKYFNKLDNPSLFKGIRPYYICLIGKREFLSTLETKCPPGQLKGGGVKNVFSITKQGLPIKYAVQFGSGNFKLSQKDPQKSILKANKDTKGVGVKKLRFSINVDFSNLLNDDFYLMDKNNYNVSDPDYDLEIIKGSSDTACTHVIKLSTSIVKPSTVVVGLKNQLPSWVNEITDNEGLDVGRAPNKTYGFKYLVEGIYEAFTIDGFYSAEIKVNVNQNN